jgi:CDP-diacylglycerol--glycerol-3-phosphate 3-phosphatidyltransferase
VSTRREPKGKALKRPKPPARAAAKAVLVEPQPRRLGRAFQRVRAVSRGFLALPFPLFRWGQVNLPNQLTLLRMVLLVPFVILFLSDSLVAQWASLGVFAVAAFTDWLDGYVARSQGLVTNFGKIMDPLADKLMMLTAMILFVQVGLVPGWMIVLIWWRELAVTGLRTLVAARRTVLAADSWGKAKTLLQVVAVVSGMLVYFLQNTLNRSDDAWRVHLESGGALGELTARVLDSNAIPYWTMFAAMILSLWSGIRYFRKNWEAVCLELEEAEKGEG